MAYVPKKAKGYNLEKDIESMGKKKKTKLTKSVKAKKAADKKKAEEPNWLDKLKAKMKQYKKDEKKKDKAKK